MTRLPLHTLVALLLTGNSALADTAANKVSPLTLSAFIEQATRNDTSFERILIDQYKLQYRHDALMPDSDIIADIKYRHHVFLDQDHESPDASVSLSKLFPFSGTALALNYNKPVIAAGAVDQSSIELLITQPIARNAFGKALSLQGKLIGIENDIVRYQVVEAYEDYLAGLTATYYNWYTAYENLRTGEASLRSNQKLMQDIRDRQRQKIALPVDVNKMKLLLIGKQENVIVLQETRDNYRNLIARAVRHRQPEMLVPVKPDKPAAQVQFERDYGNFTGNSRTYKTLALLEQQGTLEVKSAADDILPSTNLLLGYRADGEQWGIENEQRSWFGGIGLRWELGGSVARARESIAKLEHRKTVLSNQDKYEELHTNLKNLYQQIEREQALITIATDKIRLAEAVLRDEAENYSFGKVTLNDYIVAVNRVDEARFGFTAHTVALAKLQIEWLRLTDQLVQEDRVLQQPAKP